MLLNICNEQDSPPQQHVAENVNRAKAEKSGIESKMLISSNSFDVILQYLLLRMLWATMKQIQF